MDPRAWSLAPPNVVTHYLWPAKGPLRGVVLLFAALLFLFGLAAAFEWNQWIVGLVSILVSAGLLILGVWSWIAMSKQVRAELSEEGRPEEAGTHQPD